nr:MAG TPA: hypothetical protein [Caudoviricetes sp.]
MTQKEDRESCQVPRETADSAKCLLSKDKGRFFC